MGEVRSLLDVDQLIGLKMNLKVPNDVSIDMIS